MAKGVTNSISALAQKLLESEYPVEGTNGWVVSGHSNPRDIKNWYKAFIEGEPDKIICFLKKMMVML